MNKFITLLFLFSFSLSLTGTAQEVDPEPQKPGSKNVIFASVGIFPIWGIASLNYDRFLADNNRRFKGSLWLRASGGVWGAWATGGPHGNLSLVYLKGRKRSHLEFDLGFTLLYERQSYEISMSNYEYALSLGYTEEPKPQVEDYFFYLPDVFLGYRYQKPDGHFMFRAGVGFPQAVNLGLGFCF